MAAMLTVSAAVGWLSPARAPVSLTLHAMRVTPPTRMAVALTRSDLDADEAWIAELDLDAFGAEVRALGRRLQSEEGDADLDHLRTVKRWNAACALIGITTMALPLNPITVLACVHIRHRHERTALLSPSCVSL